MATHFNTNAENREQAKVAYQQPRKHPLLSSMLRNVAKVRQAREQHKWPRITAKLLRKRPLIRKRFKRRLHPYERVDERIKRPPSHIGRRIARRLAHKGKMSKSLLILPNHKIYFVNNLDWFFGTMLGPS
jgi:hypothetical protein